jgi:hypothetical protein
MNYLKAGITNYDSYKKYLVGGASRKQQAASSKQQAPVFIKDSFWRF